MAEEHKTSGPSGLSRQSILKAFQEMSVDEKTHDVGDIMFLIRHLELKSAKAVLEIVAAYYPENQIPVKAQYMVEGLFDEGKV